MPSCVPREDARYFGGAIPTMVLHSAEAVVQLPRFRLLPGGRPSTCSGWELIPGVTFSMVEGPGRFRLMVEGITHRDEVDERFAWLSAVDRAGGAVVVVIHSSDTPYAYEWGALAASGRARGGYMPVIRSSR